MRVFFKILLFVAGYATYKSLCRSVCPVILCFCATHYCPCPTARDRGCRVYGLVKSTDPRLPDETPYFNKGIKGKVSRTNTRESTYPFEESEASARSRLLDLDVSSGRVCLVIVGVRLLFARRGSALRNVDHLSTFGHPHAPAQPTFYRKARTLRWR